MLQLQSDVGGWCALAAMAACRSAARISSMPLSGVYAAAGSSANRNGTSAAIINPEIRKCLRMNTLSASFHLRRAQRPIRNSGETGSRAARLNALGKNRWRRRQIPIERRSCRSAPQIAQSVGLQPHSPLIVRRMDETQVNLTVESETAVVTLSLPNRNIAREWRY